MSTSAAVNAGSHSFLRYIAQIGERGDPTEANALLGAPTITLEEWSRQKRDARREEGQVQTSA